MQNWVCLYLTSALSVPIFDFVVEREKVEIIKNSSRLDSAHVQYHTIIFNNQGRQTQKAKLASADARCTGCFFSLEASSFICIHTEQISRPGVF